MVFEPLRDVWGWIKAHNPGSPFKKRHLSFLVIHYIYMVSLTIIGSIMIFPAGGITYVDALFFSGGAATQSGLNTVNLNSINTWQQVVLYLIGMIANPIFINTFVVFVRLYWFERRFQHVVREARYFRRTRSKSRTTNQLVDEKELNNIERGVNGRDIVVLHEGQSPSAPFGYIPGSLKPDIDLGGSDSSETSDSPQDGNSIENHPEKAPLKDFRRPLQTTPSFHRNIAFADEVTTPRRDVSSPMERMPQQMSAEQHIAFFENQRNPKDKEALRIPGPRDFDRGVGPQTVPDIDNQDPLSKQDTRPIENGSHPMDDPGKSGEATESNIDDHPVKRNITIDDSNHPHPSRFPHMSGLAFRNAATNRSHPAPSIERAPSTARPRSRAGSFLSARPSANGDKEPTPYLSWQPTIGRNSAFVDLTEEQREELGGIEYRSLKTLAIILVSYYAFFHLLGVVTLVPWILRSVTWGPIVDADGQSRAWWGIFTPATLFNDVGFTLTPDSMISFQTAIVPLLLGSFLIVIGNTGFPCMLRGIIWTINRLVPMESGIWEELRFLLDHPRRCFTLLFPADATWWLFWILILLNGIDVVFFIILDLKDPTVTSINPGGYRFLDGVFQAVSTRTAGTSVVNLANLHPAIQVSYLIMMYISVFPIAISVRRTNVYEEKSLGIYGSSQEEEEDGKEPSYIGAHLRRQLSFDLWFVFLGLFVIAIAEGHRLQDPNDIGFTMFAVLFEIVSAYGTVGLSLGYPNIDASFSAEFSVISKLVIVAMMIRGRHRGLPYELDRAILLPSESLHKKEDQDAAKRMTRRNSTASGPESNRAGMRSLDMAMTTSIEPAPKLPNNLRSAHYEKKHTRHAYARGGLGRMMAALPQRWPSSPKQTT